MAFRDAMDLAQSSSMSWEDWVQEEEEQERHSSTEDNPNLGSSPHHWRVIALVMSPWLMTVSCNASLM